MSERQRAMTAEPVAAEPGLVRPPIDWGWVVAGHLEAPDRAAVAQARERVAAILTATFPGFDWPLPLVEREAVAHVGREEVVDLLDLGTAERQAKRWDYALVITGADLAAYAKPFAFGAPARSLAVAVVSTIRIDPRARGRVVDEAARVTLMARRLTALALHLFGHLNGLEHENEPAFFMADVHGLAELDRMEAYGEAAAARLAEELAEVADLRLEEEPLRPAGGAIGFYLRTLFHNGDDVIGAVLAARPWQFPLRLSRLTTAAFSTLLVLVMTAEAWDLGMSQSGAFVLGLSLLALTLTSIYILRRQRLLIGRGRRRLNELTVVGNVSTAVIVALGMSTTYAVLFTTTLAIAATFFQRHLVEGWAASLEGVVGPGHYVVFAAFVASLGLVIGALGASFEGQRYFRHVTSVDEET